MLFLSYIKLPIHFLHFKWKSVELLVVFTLRNVVVRRPVTPGGLNNIYATLPRSLKSELLVSSVVEDPAVAAERRELTASKSVSELSQIRSFSDLPIPESLERLMTRAGTNPAEPGDPRSVATRPGGRAGGRDSPAS